MKGEIRCRYCKLKRELTEEEKGMISTLVDINGFSIPEILSYLSMKSEKTCGDKKKRHSFELPEEFDTWLVTYSQETVTLSDNREEINHKIKTYEDEMNASIKHYNELIETARNERVENRKSIEEHLKELKEAIGVNNPYYFTES